MLALPLGNLSIHAQEDTGNNNSPPAQTLEATLIVDPPIMGPGQNIRVVATLSNAGSEVAMPEVILKFPLSLTVDPAQLPAGTTLNLVNNEVIWFPVVAPAELTQLSFDFDATVADVTQPIHSVQATINYNGEQTVLQTDYWLGILPSATVSVSPSIASVGQQIQLIANVVGPGPIIQTWTLGDGRTIEATNPVIVYPATGLYTVTLQVANPLGASQSSGLIQIVPQTVSAFELTDDTVAVGEPVNFVNTSGGEAPLAYHWDFGDGNSSTEMNPAHVYNITGSFLVTLVTENGHGSSTSTKQIHVGRPPTADLVLVNPASANAPAQFTAFGDESVEQFLWDFGDGSQKVGAEIIHIYQASGDYEVTLTAANQYGNTIIKRLISVGPGVWTIHLPVAMNLRLPESQPEPAVEETAAEPSPVPEGGPSGTIPEQLFWYVNEARRLHGLPPLAYNYELTIAAQQHTDDMATYHYTGHTGADGSTPPERLQRFGYTGIYAGEATAWGFDSPIPVVEFWVNSPSHRGMILNPEATEIGLGYTYAPNAPNIWYWTVEFGRQPSEADNSGNSGEWVAHRPDQLTAQRPGQTLLA